ncbi:long-chain acyl-CoA synthetase [Pseudonocardia thermophila]|jgi:Acyl-CoA synthetases (AMP-forming)/AMP-acid ligases II|uniref:Long-chain acyl-CoA synthetase n=1 Tax=Pseudonocardia thermophila TaxID=1848 RepID=A0A1M6RZV0_PSETH|nr:long-chain fatty acid--CoA ligase [Pseudonocardia thermophila]SHK37868.1 long-chain acyl-CoA synthetase [Pseudonocardia thermophila]
MGTNLAVLLSDGARRAPDAVALIAGGARVTYRELDDRAARLAAQLRACGVEPGDRVGVLLPNVVEFAVAYYGVLRAGAVVVPMNPLLTAREVEYHLHDSGAAALVVLRAADSAAVDGARQAGVGAVVALADDALPVDGLDVAQREPTDTAVILYTSGTTGRPKGAQLTHSNLMWNAQVAADLFALQRTDVLLGALPLFHAFGQTCALNAALRRGAAVALVPRFDAAEVLDLVQRESVTVFLGVPTMYVALLAAAQDRAEALATLRLCVSGGAALPVEVLRAFEEKFGARVLEGYGLSETSPVASFNHMDRPSQPGSIGTAVWGTEMRIADDAGRTLPVGEVGEILIRGHHVMAGYWNRPDATAAAIDPDGWLRTGDLARMDEDGYFFIVDRKKDLIIRGGYNVYPREVEEVVYAHPDVLEAAVFGVPDERLGEEVAAAVVAKEGATIDLAELQAWIRERVAPYKYPRRLALLDALPKGPSGKILKREIDRSALVEPARAKSG